MGQGCGTETGADGREQVLRVARWSRLLGRAAPDYTGRPLPVSLGERRGLGRREGFGPSPLAKSDIASRHRANLISNLAELNPGCFNVKDQLESLKRLSITKSYGLSGEKVV